MTEPAGGKTTSLVRACLWLSMLCMFITRFSWPSTINNAGIYDKQNAKYSISTIVIAFEGAENKKRIFYTFFDTQFSLVIIVITFIKLHVCINVSFCHGVSV
jgi:hypothetical protein